MNIEATVRIKCVMIHHHVSVTAVLREVHHPPWGPLNEGLTKDLRRAHAL